MIVTKRQLAAHLGLSPHQIAYVWPKWRAMADFPGPVRGYRSKYDTDAFDRFLLSHGVTPTPAPAPIGASSRLAAAAAAL